MNDVFNLLLGATGWVKDGHEGGWPMMPYRHAMLLHMGEIHNVF